MGISMGGMIAQKVAGSLAPERVSALILGCTTSGGSRENPPLYPPPDLSFFSTFDKFRNDGSEKDREIAEVFLSKVLGQKFLEKGHGKVMLNRLIDRFIESRREYGKNGGGESIIRQLPAVSRWDGTDALQSVKAPTLIIHGFDDEIIPSENAAVMEKLLSKNTNVQTQTFDAGHFFFISEALKTSVAINNFLE